MAVTADTLRRVAELRNTVGAEADTAVRNLAAAWTSEWDSLAARWRVALADVLALQADLQRWPSPWELARLDRVQRSMQATEQALTVLAATTAAALGAATSSAVDATVAQEPAVIASQLPPPAVAAATVVFAGLVTAHAIAGDRSAAKRRIARTTATLAATGADTVRRALLRPRPATTDALTGAVQDAFHTSLGTAVTAARTETVDAYRAAARTVHLANSATLSGWSWHCRTGANSCIACWVMDGTEYPADVPGPDGHSCCRCVRLPIARSWRALGYTEDEPPSVILPARDKFDALPEADQVTILGAPRLHLLRSGQVEWVDLATRRESRTWRASYVPTPLRDLHRIARQYA